MSTKSADASRWQSRLLHRLSMRLASFTAGPMTVKSRRWSVPTLPYKHLAPVQSDVECHGQLAARGPVAIQCGDCARGPYSAAASAARAGSDGSPADKSNVASRPSPRNLSTWPPWFVHRVGHAGQIVVQGCHQMAAGQQIGGACEPPEVGQQDGRINGAHVAAADAAGNHA